MSSPRLTSALLILLALLTLGACGTSPPPPPCPVTEPSPTPADSPAPSPTTRPSQAPRPRFQIIWGARFAVAEWRDACDRAMSDWNKATGQRVFSWVDGERSVFVTGVDGVVMVLGVKVDGFTFGAPGPNLSVLLNLDARPLTRRLPILTHELGHLIGLSHTTDPADVMVSGYLQPEAHLSPNDIRRALARLEGDPP